MFLTGFTDEAGSDFAVQLKATRELGWKFMESRGINGKNLATLTEGEFEAVAEQLHTAGIAINCYGSAVANGGKSPRSEADIRASYDELLRVLPRMRELKIRLLRGMSFRPVENEAPDSPELEEIIFRHVRRFVEMCAEYGVIYGHENCTNYGGLSHLHTLRLLEKVNHPNLKLIFDTGNPTFTYRHIGQAPYPLQSSWEFYRNVREHIIYVHIKDSITLPEPDGAAAKMKFTFAGDGTGDVRAIVTDLRRTGYDGGFSIEPHLGAEAQESLKLPEGADVRYENYVEYGRRFEKLLKECGWQSEISTV